MSAYHASRSRQYDDSLQPHGYDGVIPSAKLHASASAIVRLFRQVGITIGQGFSPLRYCVIVFLSAYAISKAIEVKYSTFTPR